MSITIDINLEDADLRLLHEAMATDPYLIESLRESLVMTFDNAGQGGLNPVQSREEVIS